MPCSPKHRADPADHAGQVRVAEDRQVLASSCDVEALALRLEQVRAVRRPSVVPDDLDALSPLRDRDRDEVGEVARVALVRLGDVDAALLGDRRGVDEVDVLLGVARAARRSARRPSAGACRARRGGRGTRSRSGRPTVPSASAIASRPELRGTAAGTGRAPPCPRRATAGMLTAFVTTPPVSAATTCSAADHAGAVLRLGRRGAQVRRDDDVVVARTAGAR